MDKLIVIKPGEVSQRLNDMVNYSVKNYDYELVTSYDYIDNLKNKRILFAVELGNTGINIDFYRLLNKISSQNNCMENSVASVIINSNNELFTRDVTRKLILYANMAGCIFPGRPLSEMTGSLNTFSTYQKKYNMSLFDISLVESKKNVENLMNFKPLKYTRPKILTIYAGKENSNSYSFWKKVKEHLKKFEINEINIKNGSIMDCIACDYNECKTFSKSLSCYYNDIMVDKVYPAIINCDILMILCSNYNDSLGATMTALINRLTALFRNTKFYDKYIYSVIVSGHSGSDILAQQLISALNINKTFMLPPHFAFMETANDINEISTIENINKKAYEFAHSIENSTLSKFHPFT